MKVSLFGLLPGILLLATCAAAPVANAAEPERIIVTNARLVGRDAAAQDTAVNVLIVDGRLAVVTRDQLVIQPGDTAVDSNGGFLFGQLALGSRPSFVILDQDPRENVDVLLDTKTYARFAVREGVIVKNELQAIPVSSADADADTASLEGVHATAYCCTDTLLRQQEVEQIRDEACFGTLRRCAHSRSPVLVEPGRR